MTTARDEATTARVVIHVGSPKTGTTFLQDVLWSQRETATEQGLLLPSARFFDHYLASLDVRDLANAPPHPPEAAGRWQDLATEAAQWPGTSLISHELFAAATTAQVQRALALFDEGVEVHVVLTARDLVRQITAEWQEHVKHRSTTTLVDFVESLRNDDKRTSWFWRVQDFADIVDRWGATLPRSHVHVVTVPPAGSPPELLWSRFASVLRIDPGAFSTDVSRANTSLGKEQAEVLRRVNAELGERLPLPGPYAGVVKNVFAQKVLASRHGTRLALDPVDTDFAISRSREITERLAAAGVDVVGDLAELVPDAPTAHASAVPAYTEPDAEVLLDESIAALAEVLTRSADRRVQQRYEEQLRRLTDRPLRYALLQASERRPALRRAHELYRRRTVITDRLRRDPPDAPAS